MRSKYIMILFLAFVVSLHAGYKDILVQPILKGPVTFWGDGTSLSIGEDDTGYDVVFYGETASCYMLWDASEDLLSVAQTNASTSGTERAMTVTLTQTGAGAISEALYAKVIADVQTGSWVNALVGRIDYTTGTSGDAAGGMAAAICGEINLPPKAGSGGSYYAIDLEVEAPENFESNATPTSFPMAYLRTGLFGNATAKGDWQDYGYIFHFDDLTDASGNVWYDNTLRVLVEGSAFYIPLSDAEGEYSSAYQIDISNATDASSTTTGSIQTDGGVGIAKKLYVGTDLDVDGTANLDNTDIDGTLTVDGGLDLVPGAAAVQVDFQLETEWVSGILVDADFGSATTLSDDAVGIELDFNGNVTMTTDKDVTLVNMKLPALAQTAANTTNITGVSIPTAGALSQSSGAGTINWKGVNIQMPEITQSAGTVASSGVYVTGGTVNSGTAYGVNIAGTVNHGLYFSGTYSASCIDMSNASITLGDHRQNSYIRIGNYGSSSRTPITLDNLTETFAPVQMHFDIANDAADDDDQSFRPVWVWTKIGDNDQAHTSVYGIMHYLEVTKDAEDLYGCMHQVVFSDDADATVTAREIHGIQGTVEIASGKTVDVSGSAGASAVNGSIKGAGDLAAAADKLFAVQGSVEAAVGATGTTGAFWAYLAAACDHAFRVTVENVTIGDGLFYIDDPNNKIYTDGAPSTLDGSLQIKVEHGGGTETKYIPLYNSSS